MGCHRSIGSRFNFRSFKAKREFERKKDKNEFMLNHVNQTKLVDMFQTHTHKHTHPYSERNVQKFQLRILFDTCFYAERKAFEHKFFDYYISHHLPKTVYSV